MQILDLEHAPSSPIDSRGTKHELFHEKRLGLELNINRLRAGSESGRYHLHKKSDSVYVVLEGKARFMVNGTNYDLSKHSAIFLEKNEPHSIANGGDLDLLIVELYVPENPDFTLIELTQS
ncbi:MAG: cupin domain-containing protein [Thaumarchaeota archaeon]|nr:cupin domain-containing protein [Nitrososphaerota archaeon]